MPVVYDYDDESGEFSVVEDSPNDVVYIRDGLTDF